MMQPFLVTGEPLRVFVAISEALQKEHIGEGDEFVFDQTGLPWNIVKREADGIFLTPVTTTDGEPEKIVPILSFTAQTEGAKETAKRRVLDAMANIEALDRTIVKVRACPGLQRYDLGYPGSETILTFEPHVDDTSFDELLSEPTPTLEATITDSEGFVWGPVRLDPFKPEARWPFPATIGDVKLRPLGRGNRMEVTYGPFHTTLETMDAIRFANNAAVHGIEQATKDMFPNGARLGAGNPS